jgi:8-oxo-dGTP pyrophosphatase MutT (NUDIX family)
MTPVRPDLFEGRTDATIALAPTGPVFRRMPLPLFRLSPSDQRAWLAAALARPAPEAARNLHDGFRLPGREGEPTPAAVLVGIVNRPEGLQVLLTQRSADLPDHPGQISFPGGRVEPHDPSLAAAALRETTEEVGLPADRVEILGVLPHYETVTGYRVTPVVGWVEPPFTLAPDPIEVADVFEVPLAFLLDPENRSRHYRMFGTTRRYYWAIPFGERYIWGATASMLLILSRTLGVAE